MSDTSQGPGWWQASDGKWYPPEAQPGVSPTAPPPPSAGPFTTPYGAPGYGSAPGGMAPGYGAAPGGYGPPGYPPAVRKTNTKSIVSLVLGIASLVICYLGWIPGIVAVILGVQSRREVAASEGRETGEGMALAGIITGGISLLWLLAILAIVVIAIVGDDTSASFTSVGS